MKRGISPAGIGAMLKMRKIFKTEKFDYVQYSTPNAALYAAMASKLAGIKHRRYHLMGFRFLGFSGWKRSLFKTIEKFACSLSTDIECVSPSNMKLGIEEGVFPEKKARVLFYGSSAGVDLHKFDIESREAWRQELRREYGYEEDACVFGFAGRITGDKGINELLSAFRGMEDPNARLFLAGRIEDEHTLDERSMDWAKKNDKVRFCGFVPDLERYYAMMDVLVLPSYREGFGNIIIEAQAMGLPVIVTDIPGPIDAMEPGVTGLTVPGKDENALRCAMEKLCAHREIREEMGKKGRTFVEERFDQEKLAQVILEDRRELLSR
jgi:glycosyltransferase involved in cell wall biosynthesis